MAKPLLVEIFGDASQYQRTLDKAAGRTKRFGAAAKIAGGLMVTGLAVGLEKSVHAALDAEKSQARLAQAFDNAHLSLSDYTPAIEAAESAGRKLGFTDEQTKDALGSLITATGSMTDSTKQLAIAQDLARFKSVSLGDATKALTMLHAGSTRALKQLGIATVKVTTNVDAVNAAYKTHSGAAYEAALADAKLKDKQATLAQTLDIVKEKVHGQGSAFANTAQGGMEIFRAQMDHVEVNIGTKLLPALNNAVTYLNRFGNKSTEDSGYLAFFSDQVKTSGTFVDLFRGSLRRLEQTDLGSWIRRHKSLFQDLAGAIKGAEGEVVNLINKFLQLNGIHLHVPSGLPGGGGGGGGNVPPRSKQGHDLGAPPPHYKGLSYEGGGGINITVNGFVGNEAAFLVMLRQELARFRRRGGTF